MVFLLYVPLHTIGFYHYTFTSSVFLQLKGRPIWSPKVLHTSISTTHCKYVRLGVSKLILLFMSAYHNYYITTFIDRLNTQYVQSDHSQLPWLYSAIYEIYIAAMEISSKLRHGREVISGDRQTNTGLWH